jgi:hypothetical protein
LFQRPVTEAIAPGYFKVIKHPMDFQTIERRLLRFSDYYKRPGVFASDIELIVDNCKHFNSPDTECYKTAAALHTRFKHLYQKEFGQQSPGPNDVSRQEKCQANQKVDP